MSEVQVLGQTYNLRDEDAVRVQHWCHRYRVENTNNSRKGSLSVPPPIETMPEEPTGEIPEDNLGFSDSTESIDRELGAEEVEG